MSDEIDLVLFCSFIVSSVSVIDSDLYLFNELNLFNAMYLSDSLLIVFLGDLRCLFFVCFKSPITSLTISYDVGTNGSMEDMILCPGFYNYFNIRSM